MRHFDRLICDRFCRIALSIIGTCLVITSSLTVAWSGVHQSSAPQERALQAAMQLREYKSQAAARGAKSGAFDVSRAPGAVSLRVNNSVQSGSTIYFHTKMDASPFTSVGTVGGNDVTWHITSRDASSPSSSAWCGIESQGNYQSTHRIDATASATIDLTTAVAPVKLLFAESFVTERGWDYCILKVHVNADTTETLLRGGYGSAPSGNSDGWRIVSYDLSAYAGKLIDLTFEFDTGDEKYNDFPGWFVDDILVFDKAGTITGKKFFDVNNNGVKDVGERGVRDWLITADFGLITMTTRTDDRGRYTLPLPLGTYSVSEELRPNWTQKYPLSGTWSINLATPDTLVDSVHFGNYTQASFVNGRVFHDLDHDGILNNSDTVLANWRIDLEDTLGNVLNFDRSDSLGEYSLYVYQPGRYIVREIPKAGWVQSAPVAETYTIDIPNLNTVSNGNDFGNYYSPLTNAIIGQKFNDRNRNGVWDGGEEPVAGFKIQLWRKGNGSNYNLFRTRETDSSGYYQFLSLPADTYRVKEIQQLAWWRSVPESSYAVILASGETADSLNFGNYQIAPGSIGGMKFNDTNGNGVRDSGETGLQGWKIDLSGDVSATAFTDVNGQYTFPGLYPGSYAVSEVWRDGWRQTLPADLGLHMILMGPEQDLAGVDFGNVRDSSFATTFRTFMYDSLALGKDHNGKQKPVKPVPDRDEFTFDFITLNPDSFTTNLRVKFPVPLMPGTVTSTPPGTVSFENAKNKIMKIAFDPPVQVQRVTVHAFSQKPVLQTIVTMRFTFSGGSTIQSNSLYSPALNVVRWPMPNTINLLQQVGAGLKVGLGGPHSVVHPSYKEILKSLADKPDRLHLGNPRCLDKFSGPSGKSIKKQQKYLDPTKHNNVLLGEAIALQVNIRSSDLMRTPAGFGNLIYDEGTGPAMPLNNMSVREIAAALDAFMSSYKDSLPSPACTMPAPWAGLTPDTLYDRIRKINGAFSGPLDTTSFSGGLHFKGVRSVDSVGFLRYDTSSAMRPGTYYTAPLVADVPQRMELYQNYPNPFNPTTTIEFYIPIQGVVTLKVYNMLGQEVAAIFNRQEMDEGFQDAQFDAGSLGSGVYFYRLTVEGAPDDATGARGQILSEVRKMLLLK